jgi:hypothetical protein
MERNPMLSLPIEDKPKSFPPVARYRVVITGVVRARSLQQAMDNWKEYTGFRGLLGNDSTKIDGYTSSVRELK